MHGLLAWESSEWLENLFGKVFDHVSPVYDTSLSCCYATCGMRVSDWHANILIIWCSEFITFESVCVIYKFYNNHVLLFGNRFCSVWILLR